MLVLFLLCDNKILMKGLLASDVIAILLLLLPYRRLSFLQQQLVAILNNARLIFALFDIAYHDSDDDLAEWSLTSDYRCNNQLHRDNFPQPSLTFLSAMSNFEIWDKYITITMGKIWFKRKLSMSSQ